MDFHPPSPSPDLRTFAFPRRFRRTMIACALALGGLTICGLVIPFVESGDNVWALTAFYLIVFGGLTALLIPVLRALRDVVTVSPEGIRFTRPGRPDDFLRWEEIADVRSRDGLQRLEVIDRDGRRRMRLEYQLEDFGDLFRIIHERTAPQRKAAQTDGSRSEFALGRPLRFICLGGALFFAVFAAMSDPWPAIVFGGFALFCLGCVFWEAQVLEVRDDSLVLRGPLRSRSIPFRDLVDVRFEYVEVQHDSLTPRIALYRLREKPTYLGGFAGGTSPAYDRIKAQWEKWVVENRE